MSYKLKKIIAIILCVSLSLTSVSTNFSVDISEMIDVEKNVISYAEDNDEEKGSKKVKNIILDDENIVLNPYKKFLNASNSNMLFGIGATPSTFGAPPVPPTIPTVSEAVFDFTSLDRVNTSAPFFMYENLDEIATISIATKSIIPPNSYMIVFSFDIEDWYEEKIPVIIASFNEPVTFPTVDPAKVLYGAEFKYWERNLWHIESGATIGGNAVKDGFDCNENLVVVFRPKLYMKDFYSIYFDIDNTYSSKEIQTQYVAYNGSHVFPKIDESDIKGASHKSWYCEKYDIRVNANDSFTYNETTLDYTMTGDGLNQHLHFKAEFEDKNVTINYKKCTPSGAKSEVVGTDSSIVVPSRTNTKKEYGLFSLEDFKLEGWSREKNGEIVLYDIDDVYAADFIKEGEDEVTLYPVFMEGYREKEEPTPTPTPKPIGGGGSSGGGGSGGAPVYNKKGQILAPGIRKTNNNTNGTFEFDPLTNTFKYFTYDTNGEKKYVVNDWFTIIDPNTNISNWYITDANGNVLTGWVWYDGDGEDKGLYYFSKENSNLAAMLKGTQIIDDIEYEFGENGKYASGLDIMPKDFQYVFKNNIKSGNNTKTQDDAIYAFNTTFENKIETPLFGLTGISLTYRDSNDTALHTVSIPPEKLEDDGQGHVYGAIKLSYKPPAQSDKAFSGWEYRYTDIEGRPNSAVFNSGTKIGLINDISLYAMYETMEYEITYRDVHGEVDDVLCIEAAYKYNYINGDKNYQVCTPSSLPDIPKYELLGYTDEENSNVVKYKPGDYLDVTQNMTLFTVWQKKTIPLISELKLSIEKEYKVAEQKIIAAGYTPLGDLNKGEGGDAICLGYKETTDPNDAITDILISHYAFTPRKFDNLNYDMALCLDKSVRPSINLGVPYPDYYLFTTKSKVKGQGIEKEKISLECRDLDPIDINASGYSYAYYEDNYLKGDFGVNGQHKYLLYQQDEPVLSMIVDPNYPKEKLTPTDWMVKIPSKCLVSEFNMPGTHDTGTAHLKHAYPWHAKTQHLDILEQLECGTRVFDGRFGYDDGENVFYHGGNVTGINFLDDIFWGMVNWFYAFACYDSSSDFWGDRKYMDRKLNINMAFRYMINFLKAHPTETIVIRLRFEVYNEILYRNRMKEVIEKYAETGRLYLDSKIPTLGEARGKIVIVDGGWSYPSRNLGVGIPYGTQDFEEVDDYNRSGEGKIDEVNEYLDRQEGKGIKVKDLMGYDRSSHTPMFKYINFSCIGKSTRPDWNSPEVNSWFLNTRVLQNGIYYGMLNFDFIDKDIAKKVYMSNFE